MTGFAATRHLVVESGVEQGEAAAEAPLGATRPVGPQDEPVPTDRYALFVAAEAVPAEAERPRAEAGGSWIDPFVPAARALSCIGTLRSATRLDGLAVASDRAFGPDLPAGIDLAEIAHIDARVEVERTEYPPRAIGLDPFASDAPLPRLAEWRAGSLPAPLAFALRFDAPEVEPGTHVLTVSYELADGQAFTVSSDPIELGR